MNCKNALRPFDGGTACAFAGGDGICRTGVNFACAFVSINAGN